MSPKKLVDPFIPQRPNPILSTPERVVYEDDEREWIHEDNPENLIVPMDFFVPESDKYGYLSRYTVPQLLRASIEQKFMIHEQHCREIAQLATNDLPMEKKIKATISESSSLDIDYAKKTVSPVTTPSSTQAGSSASPLVNKPAENVANGLAGGKKRASHRAPSPYECMKILEARENLVCFENALYLFRNGKYEYLNFDEAISFLFTFFDELMPILGTIDYLQKIYDCLLRHKPIRRSREEINPWLISFSNGIWDVRKKQFFSSSSQLFTPFQINADLLFEPLSCPVFDAFLQEASCGNPQWIETIWEILGYCLTPDNSAKSIFVFQGKMHTGKSLISNLLEHFFPKNARSSMGIEELDQQFGACNLLGKMICISPDLKYESFKGSAVSWLKRISGGDTITTPVKYRPDMISFKPQARFVLSTNHPIHLTYPDQAFMSRLVVVPFFKTIPPEHQDKNLLDKILFEKNAILQKALWYAERLRSNNYVFTAKFPLNSKDCFDANTDLFHDRSENSNETHATAIQNFLVEYVSEASDSFLPINTLYTAFVKTGCDITLQLFSQLCSSLISHLFPTSQKTKRRVPSAPNPVNGFLNLKFKQN